MERIGDVADELLLDPFTELQEGEEDEALEANPHKVTDSGLDVHCCLESISIVTELKIDNLDCHYSVADALPEEKRDVQLYHRLVRIDTLLLERVLLLVDAVQGYEGHGSSYPFPDRHWSHWQLVYRFNPIRADGDTEVA